MTFLAQPVRTCWWFNGGGLEAAQLYVSLLPHSQIDGELPAGGEQPLVIEFTLDGAPMMILNGGPQYPQTPAASISVLTDSQADTDRLWHALTADGGQESRCGWLIDRWGVSWQIIPRRLPQLLGDPDGAAAARAQAAMMTMHRIDIAALEAAFANVEEQ